MKPLEGVLRILDWCDDQDIPKIIVTNAPRIDGEHSILSLLVLVLEMVLIWDPWTTAFLRVMRTFPVSIPAEHTLKTLGLRNRVVDVVIGEECEFVCLCVLGQA